MPTTYLVSLLIQLDRHARGRWSAIPNLPRLRVESPRKTSRTHEMAPARSDPRCMSHWLLRLCFVLPTVHLPVQVGQVLCHRSIADIISYVSVTQGWNYRDLTYFSATQSLALTIFGITAGAIMYATRRFKVSQFPIGHTWSC